MRIKWRIRRTKEKKMASQQQLENIIKEICDSFPIEESELKQVAINCGAKFKSVFASSAAKKYWEAKGQPMENLFTTTPSHTKGYTLNDVKKALGEGQERLVLSETPLFPWASRSSNNNTQYDTSLQPDDSSDSDDSIQDDDSDLWIYGNDR